MTNIIWRLRIESDSAGAIWRYYNDIPTVGEVVDFILFNRGMSEFKNLVALATRYVEEYSDDNRIDKGPIALALGLGVGVEIHLVPITLHDSIGLDFQREFLIAEGKTHANQTMQ